jgi:UDP-glucose 4-epimerase
MRILITGGAGFIGSHLCEYLIKLGHRVAVLDDLSTGKESNLILIHGHPSFSLHVGSVLDFDKVEGLVHWADRVVHLAAVVGVKNVLAEPVKTIHDNIHGTENVLVAAKMHDTPVMLASSSEVYGKSVAMAFHETDDLVLGGTHLSRWSYAATKALDEWLGFAYCNRYNLPVMALRFFNITGPRQLGRYGMVVPTFVRQAIAGLPLTVYGTGHQARTFTHVRDVVECVSALLDLPLVSWHQAVNIGSTECVSIMSLARKVQEITHTESELMFVPYEEAYNDRGFQDMDFRCPDVSRLMEMIDFVPETPLETIIQDVYLERKMTEE